MQTTKMRAEPNVTPMIDVMLVLLIVVMSARATEPPVDRQLLAPEEIGIFTAAYHEVEMGARITDTLYISAQFHGYDGVREMTEYLRPDVGEGLARAYAKANRRSGWHAGPPVTEGRHVVFAADSLLPNSMEYHAPVLEFTRPGLNATRDSAVVQAGFGCGGLCGAWQTMLLAKTENGRWYVVKSFNHMVS